MAPKIMASITKWLADYLGMSGRGRRTPIVGVDGLTQFLETRASHVAQTSLYSYLRTRAGTRYLELFQNDDFINALNVAKWQIWLACLSDLAVYAGTLIFQQGRVPADRVSVLIKTSVEGVFTSVGVPPDAGPAFSEGVRRVRARLEGTDWVFVTDDEQTFRESPDALVEWAPIVDELKQLDIEIVKNSMRFRWHEIRRNLRDDLDVEAIAGTVREPSEAPVIHP